MNYFCIEKIKSTKVIQEVIQNGESKRRFPIKIFFLLKNDSKFRLSVAFSVPKKNIPLAVNRNKIKRRMKESFRNNSINISPNNQSNLQIVLYFIGNEIPKYKDLDKCIKKHLEYLQSNYDN